MLNTDFDVLRNWMFGKLNTLLIDKKPNPIYEVIKMSIGEPQLPPPDLIYDEINKNASFWGAYPPSVAIPRLNKSIMNYLNRRFPGSDRLVNPESNILPVPGTREPLHLLGLIAKNKNKKKTKAIVTNPYYHAWRTGGIDSNSEIYYVNANSINNFNPDLDGIPESILNLTVIMYLCFPSNPHGGVTTVDYLKKAIYLARKFNFVLALDECYIDIFRLNNKKPIGGLDALIDMNSNLKNIVIFNSLSKRNNVPGLRAGFIVGDEKILDIYKLLVSNGASPVPIPVQNAAAALYDDDKHNQICCKHYDKNFNIAKKYLSPFINDLQIPNAGFFLWLPVKDDIKAAINLWINYSVMVMPGSFMAECVNDFNPGKGYLRIALVHKNDLIINAIQRLAEYFKKYEYN